MKGNFYSILGYITALLTGILTSCSDGSDVIWDIYPVQAEILIKDVNGNNLLNPEIQNNLFGKNISIEYDGKTNPVQWQNQDTRAYMAQFYGLRFMEGWNGVSVDPDKNHLEFGEFDGASDQDLSLILRIEERPETYKIEILHKFWYKGSTPHQSTTTKLNGVEISGSLIIVTID